MLTPKITVISGSNIFSESLTPYDVNCVDMAKAVVTFNNSVGCSLEVTTYGYSGTFPLNCIDPFGSPSPTNNAFSSPLIDYNPDNVSGSNPECGSIATGYSWTNPCNEIELTYISRLKEL